MASKRYWRIMLGARSALAEECFAGGFMGGHHDLLEPIDASLPADWPLFRVGLTPHYASLFPDRPKRSIGLSVGQLHAICRGIREGDVLLAPTGDNTYRIGTVSGGYRYVEGAALPHRRPVEWSAEYINRAEMSEPLRRSLQSGLTLIRLDEGYFAEVESLRGGDKPKLRVVGDDLVENPLMFAMEAHLEDFLVRNWSQTQLGREYDIVEEDGVQIGQQFLTDTGPIDILAVKKDGSGYLVVELKRGRASDSVVGQILRYLSYVQESLAEDGQEVRGAIIALDDDPRLRRSLDIVADRVEFFRYRVDFSLEPGSA